MVRISIASPVKEVSNIRVTGPATVRVKEQPAPMVLTHIGDIISAMGLQQQQNGSGQIVTRDIINPGVVLANLDLTFPLNPVDGQRHEFFFGGTIAAGDPVVQVLSIGPNVYQDITPLQANGGDVIAYEYELAQTLWRRVK